MSGGGNRRPNQPLGESFVPVARRRELARMLNQGLLLNVPVRELPALLEGRGFINPHTGERWHFWTCWSDLKWIREQMVADSVREATDHKADILASLRELFSQASVVADRKEARLLLNDIAKLLGANAPEVFVFESVQARMLEALGALREEFGDEPEVWRRVVGVFSGLGRGAGEVPVSGFRERVSN